MNNAIVNLDTIIKRAVSEITVQSYETYVSLQPSKLNDNEFTFNKKMTPIVKKADKKEDISKLKRYIMKAALAFCIIFSVAFSPFLTVAAVREDISNIVIEWNRQFAEFVFPNTINEAIIGDVAINYIPDDYTLIFINENSNKLKVYSYQDSNGDFFDIEIFIPQDNNFYGFDNENTIFHNISIGDENCIWLERIDIDYNILIVYTDDIVFNISGQISLDELVKIYENIEIL